MIVASALVIVLVLAAVYGRRLVAVTGTEKVTVLSRFEGQEVILGVSGLVVHGQLVLERRGQLRVESDGVVLSGEKERRVLLGQIRWLVDPRTGVRYGRGW